MTHFSGVAGPGSRSSGASGPGGAMIHPSGGDRSKIDRVAPHEWIKTGRPIHDPLLGRGGSASDRLSPHGWIMTRRTSTTRPRGEGGSGSDQLPWVDHEPARAMIHHTGAGRSDADRPAPELWI